MFRVLCAGLLVLLACPALAQTQPAAAPQASSHPDAAQTQSAATVQPVAATPVPTAPAAQPQTSATPQLPPDGTSQPFTTPISTGEGPPPLGDGSTSASNTTPGGTTAPDTDHFDASQYIKPTWVSLINTMAAFKAIDYKIDPQILDDYAIAVACDIYIAYHDDEFKWRQIRQDIAQMMTREAAKNPINYRYEVPLQIGSYDFDTKIFRFREHSDISNINAFLMSSDTPPTCGRHEVKLPSRFRAVLSVPVSVRGIPMSPEQGEALLNLFRTENNTDRILYTRFNMHVIYIEHLSKQVKKRDETDLISYTQGGQAVTTVQMGAELDNVQFFSDKDHRNLIYTFKP